MARFSKIAKEPATLWLARIEAFQRMAKDDAVKKDKYRAASECKFRNLLPIAGDDGRIAGSGLDHSGLEQIPVNLSRRYIDRLQSLATDDDPLIYSSRDTEEDEDAAGMVERLAARTVRESRLTLEFRSAIMAVSTFGATMVFVGFHGDVVSGDEVAEVSKGTAQVVEEVLGGQHVPSPGQDHKMLAEVLVKTGSDPVAALGPGGTEAVIATHEAAAGHVEAAIEEAKEPSIPWVTPREVWSRRLPVGTWCGWDNSVWDFRDARWVWRKLVMTKDEALNYPLFNRRVVNKLEPKPLSTETGYQKVETAALMAEECAQENQRCVVYEVWDKRFRTRHYVAEGLEDYLERDESDPNMDPETGESMPGFFPCVYCAPLLADSEEPTRTLGIAALAPGFPQQEEIIKLRSFAMAAAKRCARLFIVNSNVDDDARAGIENAVDGTTITRPEGLDKGEPVVEVVQWTGEFPAIRAEADRVLTEWAMLMEYPLAELTTQATAETATQEEIAKGGGNQRTGYIVRQLESCFGEAVQKILWLVRAFYPDEKIVGLLGPKYAEKWAAWRRSSLDGDKIRVKFAGRAKEEQAVKTKQSMDLFVVLSGQMSPIGLPKWNTDSLLESVARGLGHELTAYKPTQEELMMAMMAGGQPGQPPAGGPGGGEGGDPGKAKSPSSPQVPGSQERAKRPYPGREQAAAQRTGPA